MNRKKKSSLFVTACFLLFLCGMMVMSVLREKTTYSYYENRNLAAAPEVTKEALCSGRWGTEMEQYLSDHAALRNTLLKLDTKLKMDILRQPVVNDIVVTDDCLLPKLEQWRMDTSTIPEDVEVLTENLVSLKDLTQSYGATYYYVAVPCQDAFYVDQYPEYIDNRAQYFEESTAALAKSLSEAQVNFIDTGLTFAQYGWAEELTSKIDHHYSIRGAYLTYRDIMRQINQDTGLELDVLEEGEYTLQELPNPYLGSRQRKLLGLWPCEEKLSVLWPNEPVAFTRMDNGVESMPVTYVLPSDPGEEVLYSVYMGGDIAFTQIDTGRSELPDILVYGDSFTNAVECMLYTGFDTMYSLDMRHYREKTLGEFIAEYRPDIVVCIRDYGSLLATVDNGRGVD